MIIKTTILTVMAFAILGCLPAMTPERAKTLYTFRIVCNNMSYYCHFYDPETRTGVGCSNGEAISFPTNARITVLKNTLYKPNP